eukprot:CAMPEP_0170737726 /NCGR_PEP_ID=MMETSP0437-20130122/4273_1 /TAXON_ID=0 /ORGANISM="Sexangularia sp." /LENGTH=153 /DNA_ID=CAMNT_0011076117 /DNA_START=13 /DNA_END=473 /DNA_ORIENTATION=+
MGALHGVGSTVSRSAEVHSWSSVEEMATRASQAAASAATAGQQGVRAHEPMLRCPAATPLACEETSSSRQRAQAAEPPPLSHTPHVRPRRANNDRFKGQVTRILGDAVQHFDARQRAAHHPQQGTQVPTTSDCILWSFEQRGYVVEETLHDHW